MKSNINNKSQLSRTIFLKYGSLDLHDKDVKNIFKIDNDEIQFDKNNGWALIEIIDEPNGLMFDHDYFFIH